MGALTRERGTETSGLMVIDAGGRPPGPDMPFFSGFISGGPPEEGRSGEGDEEAEKFRRSSQAEEEAEEFKKQQS